MNKRDKGVLILRNSDGLGLGHGQSHMRRIGNISYEFGHSKDGLGLGYGQSPKTKIKVAIMPGHGGNDPGACNGEVKEKDYNWREASYLKRKLETSGYEVKVCRNEGEDLVSKMEKRANDFKADICFCLHHNGNENKETNGWEVHYYTEKSKKLAEYCWTSCLCKLSIQNSKNGINPIKTKKGTNAFNCIHLCTMPTVLIESCYISNDEDCKWLITNGWDQIVNALYAATELFMNDGYMWSEQSKQPKQKHPGIYNVGVTPVYK